MKKQSKLLLTVSLVAGVSFVVSAELFARFGLGLGEPIVYESAADYGYRALPNQNLRRFGNRIFYNAQGLRSEPIATKLPSGTIRVLCIGDSITYGGSQTDQALTYPYKLQEQLNQNSQTKFQVLNASAGGWAIANQEAYLRRFGIYNSQIVVLQMATHDLFQPKTSGDMVGKTQNYPDRKPLLALEEGLFRYFLPRYLPSLQPPPDPGVKTLPTKQDLQRNLASLVAINHIVKQQQGKLVIFSIEQPTDVEPQDTLTNQGKQALAQKVKELGIPYISLRNDFRQNGDRKLFYDDIHPNPAGNRVMARGIEKLIRQEVVKP